MGFISASPKAFDRSRRQNCAPSRRPNIHANPPLPPGLALSGCVRERYLRSRRPAFGAGGQGGFKPLAALDGNSRHGILSARPAGRSADGTSGFCRLITTRTVSTNALNHRHSQCTEATGARRPTRVPPSSLYCIQKWAEGPARKGQTPMFKKPLIAPPAAVDRLPCHQRTARKPWASPRSRSIRIRQALAAVRMADEAVHIGPPRRRTPTS